jgi:hypothetical protein
MVALKISALTEKTTLVDGDEFAVVDSEASPIATKMTKVPAVLGQAYQGRRYQIFNPYVTRANVYKGQTHFHSDYTGDDGVDTPAAIVTAYKNAGYHFVCLTGHGVITPDPSVADILYIPGVEETVTDTWDTNHLNADAVVGGTNMQARLEAILLEANALSCLNHPTTLNPSHYLSLDDLNLVELKTSSVNNETVWKNLLDANKDVWGIAGDDCHDLAGADFNINCVMVYADTLSIVNIIDSLRNGNFYSMEVGGSTIVSISVSDGVISIEVSASSNIEFLGKGDRALQTDNATTTASYTILGNERYIRIRITNVATSKKTWTNRFRLAAVGNNFGDYPVLFKPDISGAYLSAMAADMLGNSPCRIPLNTSGGSSVKSSGWTFGDLYPLATSIASGGSAVQIIDSDVSPVFTTAKVLYARVDWTDGSDANPGVGWITAVVSGTELTISKVSGADFIGNGGKYHISAGYFTVRESRWYSLIAKITYVNPVADSRLQAGLIINGTYIAYVHDHAVISDYKTVPNTIKRFLTIGDIVALAGYSANASNAVDIHGAASEPTSLYIEGLP